MGLLDGIHQGASGPSTGDDDLAMELRRSLDSARPHQLGLGGCGALVGGLLVLGGLAIPTLVLVSTPSPEDIGVALSGGLCYISAGAVYLVPAMLLIHAAQALALPTTTPEQVLEGARRLERFWRAAAVASGLIVFVYAVMIVVIVALAAIGASLAESFEDVASEVESAH